MIKNKSHIHTRPIIACIWDFDKTLIPGYMQSPLFEHYQIEEKAFWTEIEQLPHLYRKQGIGISADTVYLNHLLSYVKNGPLKGLNNAQLRNIGKKIVFYPGLPHFFQELKDFIRRHPLYHTYEIKLEHYIISTGLAEMIRGSAIAPYVEGIFGCEFIENVFPPHFSPQEEFKTPTEIRQIGVVVDNTIKTRFIFEINKGSNKNGQIDVNAVMKATDRRVPIQNMIYIADGPSDIPVFSVVRRNGGKTYAVYNPERQDEFAQNDSLLQVGRIHAYGPADYRPESQTARWLKMHLSQIADRIVKERKELLSTRISQPPKHLHEEEVETIS